MAPEESKKPKSPPRPAPSRVIVEGVTPEIDAGRFPVKRTVGEEVVVSAFAFTDGHDNLAGVVKYRVVGAADWSEASLRPLGQDLWTGVFVVRQLGWYEYTVEAWIDWFATWLKEITKKAEAGQDVGSELLEGARLVREAAGRATGAEADWLRARADVLGAPSDQGPRVAAAIDPALAAVMVRYPDRSRTEPYDRVLRVMVERERARYGAWYEMFPRSCSPEPGRHGTFRDAEARLPYVASMGFDVLYLPPIHPIGRSFRKGPNNSLTAGPDDPGSPWAIGGPEGGHKAVHPELGTLEDFDRLVASANALGLEIALDIAFQCSPDHPYVREHPQWFRHRPDGTIKYAENPPKKYQDIYPIDFENDDWEALWAELRDVFLFWIGHGVKIFRVDNPHTKPFRFWDWVIRQVWDKHPETIFLAEAFTRPKVMHRLAKGGYPQSYSYFTWRNTKWALTQYFTELTQTDAVEYMRPNLFANTPDILHEFLQYGGRPAFQIRLVLAATLGATYGIYGPPFEQCVGAAWKPGSEEYLDSEKYQVRHWDLDRPGNLRAFIARVNAIRRENPALHHDRNLRFFQTDNDQILAYGKATPDLSNIVVVVVNLDPYHVQSGWVHLPLGELGLGAGPESAYQVHDLISESRFLWHGESNFVLIDPQASPAHIFRVRRKVKTERDFDYYM
ncbi:Alpha-1,4-glucan:maltose-1-phosphate maltosyltransferase 1 [Aquisphaera giovannonii]|uniref:Alpha-1,4-glucan:maltose-1-phosphate maltosyltransferase n=1 Tax=Aquisphaera giovannonii TaxID=406548 RepID=A0A5B9W271_9BACT|nr:alpha-1,4-glucan--maltose-1-phosphate maltosyltransferase [Aquisphaera giovannonii]QEH34648.1 Alpha-1,4-glucan:maltose-1-phosphate maltosyltransferase 1 [Aquisphaera giovannonii]